MPELALCPKCRTELLPESPAGLCPKCLMLAGLDRESDLPERSDGGKFAANTIKRRQLVPPEPHVLAAHFPQLEILDLIGHGGMGAVYKARQPKLDRLVALKVIRPDTADDPAFAQRFHREARALARLNHPQIVGIHDFGEVTLTEAEAEDSAPRRLYYFVMEYVDGTDLRQLIDSGELRPEQALAIVPQICDALQYAHEEGVVHRDIKPENVLIDRKGRVKIADFGLAKLASGLEDDLTLTATRQVMGTLRYMAPEQMEGSHAVDHRADIYSLGVVFYEMLTGEVPMGSFAPPSQKVPIDERLDAIVLRAMAREPERRYQQASELSSEIGIVRGASSVSHENSTPWLEEPIGPSTFLDRKLDGIVDRLRTPREPVDLTLAGGRDWVTLSREQVEFDDLPELCIVCGAPARQRVNRNFQYQAEWAQILTFIGIFAGLFPGLIVAAFTTHEQRMACPVCPRHRNHWSRLVWFLSTGWLIPVLLAAVGFFVVMAFDGGVAPRAWGPVAGVIVGLIVYGGVGIYLASVRIDAEWISDTAIRLRRVSAAFARAAARDSSCRN